MTSPKILFTIEQPHGLGELYFSWQKGESRSLIATTGTDATIAIYNRHGQLQERMKLQGLCAGMEWDSDGDLLAAITPNSFTIMLWECHTNKRISVETGLKEVPTCLAWACAEPLLAVGTLKGNIALYNHHTTKRIPIIGKHTKKITCAAWNNDNILALASEDKTLSINNSDGETLRIISLRDQPNDLQFSEMKTDERIAGENTISLVVGKRTLYLYNLLDPENPIELAFQNKYGSIVTYKWYGDGYILIGFNAGFLIAISTHIKEVGQELFQVKNHKDTLSDVAICNPLGQAATCGDNQLKLYSLWDNSEVISTLTPPGGAERCSWNSDNQLLAVAGRSYLNAYICSLPSLYAAYNTHIISLTSLTEATVFQCISTEEADTISKGEPVAIVTYNLISEPSLLSIGANYACAVHNNLGWFYSLAHPAATPIQRMYPAAINRIIMATDYAAALFDGKIMLHMVEAPSANRTDQESKIFPEPAMQDAQITDAVITGDFLIFATNSGHVHYFALEEWRTAVRYMHSSGIKAIFADPAGTRLVVLDTKSKAFVYNPLNDDIVHIEGMPQTCKGVIWDICLTERNVFCAYTEDSVHTYYFCARSINGSFVEAVATTNLLTSHVPVLCCSGEVYCYIKGGSVAKISLESHTTAGLADVDASKRAANQRKHLEKLTALRRFNEAWIVCDALDERECWLTLGESAIANLEVDFAIRVYTHLSDVAMVWALEDASQVEDISILCGLLSVCAGRAEAGARWLEGAGSARAESAALALCAARLQWGRAAELARRAAPVQLPLVTREYAAQLEFTGDYHEALSNYEKSVIENVEEGDYKSEQHNGECLSGIARMSIRCGDVLRAMTILMKNGDNEKLTKECAKLLEEGRHYTQAAALYDQIGESDKAASLYIKLKSWLKVEALLPKITSPKIHIQYAKAKEGEGRYAEALKSYVKAKDFDSAVRLNLDHLNDPDEAVQIVQETKSIQGAKMVANFFQKYNDYTSAIRFLIMSLCYEEAFQLARKYGKLQLYGEILIQVTSQTRPDDFKSLALHFEGEKNYLLAGKFYFHAKEYAKAMSHLLKVGSNNTDEENEAITLAIDTAASSGDEHLTKHLIEYLLGEVDGNPKEPKYLFRLYMARKQFAEAAKTAVIIANQEQVSGNYRTAHDVLLTMCQELRSNGLPVPADMRHSLGLLHSYILVRLHIKRGDHNKCARMLIRVAKNISFFPTHIVPILTSTIIECSRAGLKKSAYTYARLLMKPEYRPLIEAKYVKKIESVIRHPPRGADENEYEALTPCPQCGTDLPESELVCNACKITIPFCIATGCHIVKDDLTACPECDFPAIQSEFVIIVEEEGQCPMCWENIDYRRLPKIENINSYLHVAT